MDQNPAQYQSPPQQFPPVQNIGGEASPIKKIITVFGIFIFILIVLLLVLMVLSGSPKTQSEQSLPESRPTATPAFPSAMPTISQAPEVKASDSVKGDLVFIKDGDIYISDLSSYALLIKPDVPAGDRLSWSPEGNFLAWRPKSQTATPSAVTVYDRREEASITIRPAENREVELIDYDWSPDEKDIAVLYFDRTYKISIYPVNSSQESALVANQVSVIRQVFWPEKDKIVFSGEKGIYSTSVKPILTEPIIEGKDILHMSLSPDSDKILYSVGDRQKSDLFLVDLAGRKDRMIYPNPSNIDMGISGFENTVLEKGFLPFAFFIPGEESLLVGYHYMDYMPLVGIYNLEENSFSAIKPFSIYSSDIIISKELFLGARVNTAKGKSPSWEISVFSIIEGEDLSVQRVIRNAYSPDYLFKNAQSSKSD